MIDYLTSALATLLVVADPIFLSALFLGLTHGIRQRSGARWRCAVRIIAFCILVAAGLGGAKLLELLGISLSAFRIAGGLLLLSSAAEMVFDRRSQRLQATADTAVSVDHVKNIAAFPLAIPLMAGPGRHHRDDPAGRAKPTARSNYLAGLFGVTALVMLACYLSFLMAERISKTHGHYGARASSRGMLGIILAALAVQFVIDGVDGARPQANHGS